MWKVEYGLVLFFLGASECLTSKCDVGEIFAPRSPNSQPLCLWLELHPAPADVSNDKCKSKGGTLATVANADVQSTVRNMLLPYKTTSAQFYIGVHDIPENGYYRTYSGHAQQFFSWDTSAYISPQEASACVMVDVDEDSNWREVNCSFPKKAVCSRPVIPRVNSYLFRKISPNNVLMSPVLYERTTKSLLECGAICVQDVSCLSFCHAAINGRCVLNIGTNTTYTLLSSDIFNYYELISSEEPSE